MKEIRLHKNFYYGGWSYRYAKVLEEIPEVGGWIRGIEVIKKVEFLGHSPNERGDEMYDIYGVSGDWDSGPSVDVIAVLAEEEEA